MLRPISGDSGKQHRLHPLQLALCCLCYAASTCVAILRLSDLAWTCYDLSKSTPVALVFVLKRRFLTRAPSMQIYEVDTTMQQHETSIAPTSTTSAPVQIHPAA